MVLEPDVDFGEHPSALCFSGELPHEAGRMALQLGRRFRKTLQALFGARGV